MAQNLDQHFIDLGDGSLGPNGPAELGLNHREGGFHVAALMVVGQELRPIGVVVVVHPLPQGIPLVVALVGHGIALERDVRLPAHSLDFPQVPLAQVRLVSRDFGDIEMLCRGFEQRGQEWSVVGVGGSDFHAGHDIGFYAAHQVSLNPLSFFPLPAVLVVKPAAVDRGREPAGVHGEVRFQRSERQGELDKVCAGFVAPGPANKDIYRAILERLLPPGAGIPGPVLTRQDVRDAVNAIKPGYKDVFRRMRELQGEEGLTGIIKHRSMYQLVSLAVGEKRHPRIASPLAKVVEVALRQGGRCAVCGAPIGAEGPARAELDHKVPRIRGGDNRDPNLQGLCVVCNNAKSTQCANCDLDCATCGWAYPERFRPVKLRADVILRLNERAQRFNQDVDQLTNTLLDQVLRDG